MKLKPPNLLKFKSPNWDQLPRLQKVLFVLGATYPTIKTYQGLPKEHYLCMKPRLWHPAIWVTWFFAFVCFLLDLVVEVSQTVWQGFKEVLDTVVARFKTWGLIYVCINAGYETRLIKTTPIVDTENETKTRTN